MRHPAEILLGFARALRAAGVPVTVDREHTYLAAVAEVGLDDDVATYLAGRATLCGSPDDLARYDQVYAAWFSAHRAGPSSAPPMPTAAVPVASLTDEPDGSSEDGSGADDESVVIARASDREALRHKDIATLSARERERMARLFARLTPHPPMRRAHRHTPVRRGQVDARKTLRASLRNLGEPGPIRRRRRGLRSRRVVLLVDVSGSMAPYADALLRLAHRFGTAGVPVEVFTLGTRLTQVTRALRQRDPDRALVAAGDAIPDWSGGTRLAEGIEAFLRRWGRRGLARGAVVVVFSDGWERTAPEALGEQVRRLRALAHAVVWVNPHRGRPGYEPIQGGILAVLPHVDDFVAGHSMAAFEDLLEVVAHA